MERKKNNWTRRLLPNYLDRFFKKSSNTLPISTTSHQTKEENVISFEMNQTVFGGYDWIQVGMEMVRAFLKDVLLSGAGDFASANVNQFVLQNTNQTDREIIQSTKIIGLTTPVSREVVPVLAVLLLLLLLLRLLSLLLSLLTSGCWLG